MLNIQYNY